MEPTEPFDYLPVIVEVHVGSREMAVEELLQLEPGAVFTLDRSAGEMLDVLVAGVRVASAEVVVTEDRLGVRITECEEENAA